MRDRYARLFLLSKNRKTKTLAKVIIDENPVDIDVIYFNSINKKINCEIANANYCINDEDIIFILPMYKINSTIFFIHQSKDGATHFYSLYKLLKNNDGRWIFIRDSFYNNDIRTRDPDCSYISYIGYDAHKKIKNQIEFYLRLIEENFVLAENIYDQNIPELDSPDLANLAYFCEKNDAILKFYMLNFILN